MGGCAAASTLQQLHFGRNRQPCASEDHRMHRVHLLLVGSAFLMSAGIATPAIYQANAQQARKENVNNLKQIAIACHCAHDVNGQLPQTVGTYAKKDGALHYHLMPYVEQLTVYNNNDLTANVPVMRNAADQTGPEGGVYKRTWAVTNYAANWLVFGGGP